MMKAFSKYALALSLSVLCLFTHADELNLQYAGFYDYLKQANSPDFNQVRPAFFLTATEQDNAYCVSSGEIVAGDVQYPIVTNSVTGEFFVPFDKRIKDQRGLLKFAANESCQLNIAVVGKLHQQQVSTAQLQVLAEQIYDLMKEYAGSVSFMMPDWQAIILVYEDGTQQRYSRTALPPQLVLEKRVDHVRLAMAQE